MLAALSLTTAWTHTLSMFHASNSLEIISAMATAVWDPGKKQTWRIHSSLTNSEEM